MVNCNDPKLLHKAYLYLDRNGKDVSWSALAKMFGIKNMDGGYGGDTLRVSYKSYNRKHRNPDVASMVGSKMDGASKIKEYETYYGDKRYSVTWNIDKKTEELKEFQKLKDGLLKDIKKYVKPVKKQAEYKRNNACAIINIFDAHLNKLCYHKKGQSLESNIKVFEDTFDELMSVSLLYRPELIIFPVGGDFFHSDNLTISTTAGTQLNCIASPEEEFRQGVKVLRRCIDKASNITKVIVPVVEGNHDRNSSYFLGQILGAVYENNGVVTVDNSRNSRKYYTYGKNLFGFCHGDREVKKIDLLPLLMAEEKKDLWAKTKYRDWFIGDRHHKFEYKFMRNKDFVGCSVRFLRSISGLDKWHTDMCYVGIPKTAELFIYDKNKGLKGNYPINI